MENTLSSNSITFRMGDELKVVIEDKLNESIFVELYHKAFKEIDNYLIEIDKKEKNTENINNVFAFIGERGSGKTSCMKTIANALISPIKRDILNSLKLKDGSSIASEKIVKLNQTNFDKGFWIDPSFFDERHNILSLIIAYMFKDFKKKITDKELKYNNDNKRKLIEGFEKIQKHLNVLFNKAYKNALDNIEALADLSSAVDLCEDIRQLIDEYLTFKGNDYKQLIIMIDDIDLNTKYAREMSEQIRKYFNHPNVIILMAVKLDQLGHAIRNNLTEEYKVLLDKNNSILSSEELSEMVDKYLGKFIPHNHRLYLPEASNFFEKELILKVSNSQNSSSTDQYIIQKGKLLKNYVLEMIFLKTRYLFFNSKTTTSYIIPRNLRELRQLIVLLYNMDEFRNAEIETSDNVMWNKTRHYNQTLFLKYFLETWCKNNLSNKAIEAIQELFKLSDPLLINKTVISLMNSYFVSSGYLPSYSDNSEVNRILKSDNKNYNISLGDSLYIFKELQTMINKTMDMKFLFAIKFFYSYTLYTYYNNAKIKIDNIDKIYKSDVFSNFNSLEKIISGGYINTENTEYLDQRKGNVAKLKIPKASAGDKKIVLAICDKMEHESISSTINYVISTLKEITNNKKANAILVNSFIELYETNSGYVDELSTYLENLHTDNELKTIITKSIEDFKVRLNKAQKVSNEGYYSRTLFEANLDGIKKLDTNRYLALKELFATLISRRPDTKNADTIFRIKNEARFNSVIKNLNQKKIYLDVFAPLFNLLDLKKCYSRLDGTDDLFEQALANKDSLISKLFDELSKRIPETGSGIDDFKKLQIKYEGTSVNDERKDIILELRTAFDQLQPAFLSMVTIRNIEILEELESDLLANKTRVPNSGGEVNVYKSFYDSVSRFNMQVYTPDDKSSNYDINVSFFNAYSRILSDDKNKSVFDRIIK